MVRSKCLYKAQLQNKVPIHCSYSKGQAWHRGAGCHGHTYINLPNRVPLQRGEKRTVLSQSDPNLWQILNQFSPNRLSSIFTLGSDAMIWSTVLLSPTVIFHPRDLHIPITPDIRDYILKCLHLLSIIFQSTTSRTAKFSFKSKKKTTLTILHIVPLRGTWKCFSE